MRKLIYVFVAATFLVVQSSCFFDFDNDDLGCIKGNRDIATEELFLPDFHSLKVSGNADVFLRQGDVQKVEVEIDKNLISRIDMDVRSGEWNIKLDGCVSRVTRFEVFITVPDIRSLNISGSGNITGENNFSGNRLDLKVSGSGDLDIFFDGNKIDGRIIGSGDTRIDGFTDFLDYQISGSGDLSAFGLEAKDAKLQISGSGDAEVRVIDFLSARISGSGDLFYKGDPSTDFNITGSGKAVKVD